MTGVSADAALDFVTATLVTVLQDLDQDAVFTFAAKFIPAVFAGRVECAQDVEALARGLFPDHPEACREIAGLTDRMVSLVRQAGD